MPLLIRILLITTVLTAPLCFGQAPSAGDAQAEIRGLAAKIEQRLSTGASTPDEFADELSALDAMVNRYRFANPELAATALVTRVTLYLQVFQDSRTALTLIRQLARDFPQTASGADATQVLAQIDEQNRMASIQSSLIGEAAPKLDFVWASRDGLKSLQDLKGKVVILDFWATWCGPYLDSIPQVAALARRYQDSPVEIVGVTSLQGQVVNLEPRPIDCTGDPEKEYGLMPRFMQAKGMIWTVAFSRQPVMNPEYGINGIPSMVIIAPDGSVRHAGLHPAMPHEEKVAMIDAILEEFGLEVPGA